MRFKTIHPRLDERSSVLAVNKARLLISSHKIAEKRIGIVDCIISSVSCCVMTCGLCNVY